MVKNGRPSLVATCPDRLNSRVERFCSQRNVFWRCGVGLVIFTADSERAIDIFTHHFYPFIVFLSWIAFQGARTGRKYSALAKQHSCARSFDIGSALNLKVHFYMLFLEGAINTKLSANTAAMKSSLILRTLHILMLTYERHAAF